MGCLMACKMRYSSTILEGSLSCLAAENKIYDAAVNGSRVEYFFFKIYTVYRISYRYIVERKN